jgi:uncharacterized membrane protein
MTEAAADYIPVGVLKQFRRQAIRVWTIAFLVVLLWVLAIVIAPLARAGGLIALADPIYHFFSFICHQLPARSFFVDGEPFGVCSRCFGVYLGLLTGMVVYPFWRPIDEIEPLPRFWLFLSLVPMAIDWSLTFFGIWENTLLSRFVTGMILGLGCATFIIPALVEVTRNLTSRRVRIQR